jgi:nitrogen fixation protein NifX
MTMKVAFTTSDSIHINAHFGWAKKIDFYEVDKNGAQFLETVKFGGDLKEDGNEDKLVPKVDAVNGCTLIYVSAIGGSAASRLLKKNVTPIKAKTQSDTISETLDELIETLNGSPPPWLRKALSLGMEKATALNFEDDE